jgi:hypothetical protein
LLAGAMMKLIGMGVAITAFGVSFYHWYQADAKSNPLKSRRATKPAG